MRWWKLSVGCAMLVCQAGCQNLGGGGYPMQSVTRVPPPGTGSYPVQGGYYNNPAAAQTSAAPGTMAAPVASMPAAGPTGSVGPEGSFVSQAQFTAPEASSSFPAGVPVQGTSPQTAEVPSIPSLQWQGTP